MSASSLLNPPVSLQNELALAEVDSASLSPKELHLRKTDILRRSLLTAWLFIPELQSALLPQNPAAGSPETNGLQENERQILANNLEKHLTNVRLGTAMLSQMNIIPAPGTVPTEFNSFHDYAYLPPEMHWEILKWLTSPQDKLTVVKTIPYADLLMYWDPTELEFEAIAFPNLLKSGKLNWRKFHKFRTSSPHSQRVINRWYEDYLGTLRFSNAVFFNDGLDGSIQLFRLMRHDTNDRWTTLDPIICKLHLTLKGAHGDNDEFQHKLRLLEGWAGPRIWDCEFDHTRIHLPADLFLQRLSRFLERMPNLRRLRITTNISSGGVAWDDIANITLPKLHFLKALSIQNRRPLEWTIRKKLLEVCGPQLKNLGFLYLNDGENLPLPDVPNVFPTFHQLTSWYCESDNCSNWNFHCYMLHQLKDSPLKDIDLWVGSLNGENRLLKLLQLLGMHFGGTLEKLNIAVGVKDVNLGNSETDVKLLESLENLTFHKLKLFSTNLDPGAEGWDFLLLFPALENLEFYNVYNDTRIERMNTIKVKTAVPAILEISSGSDVKTLKRANVWKLLPYLQNIKKSVFENIAREECMS